MSICPSLCHFPSMTWESCLSLCLRNWIFHTLMQLWWFSKLHISPPCSTVQKPVTVRCDSLGQASRCRWSSLPFITSLLARAERYSESVMLEVSLCASSDQMRWALMFGGGPSRSSSSDPISDPVVDTRSGVRTLIPLWPVDREGFWSLHKLRTTANAK